MKAVDLLSAPGPQRNVIDDDGRHSRRSWVSRRATSQIRSVTRQDSEWSHTGRIFVDSSVIRARRSRASRAGSVTYSRNVRLVSILSNFTCSG
jgi:hypothetical protein